MLPVSLIPERVPAEPKRSTRSRLAASDDTVNALTIPEPDIIPETKDDTTNTEHTTESTDSTTEPDMSDDIKEDVTIVVLNEDISRSKTLKELREMCVARGLPSNGKKSELVDRLTGTNGGH